VKLRDTRSVNQANAKIRIVAVPPGEAPLWVRQQWVGLELPLTRYTRLQHALGFGILSGPSNRFTQIWGVLLGRAERAKGYAVEGAKAVEALESSSPDAARWWREHAPQCIAPGRYLLFHDHVCQVIAD
jgi:hypothetical protein